MHSPSGTLASGPSLYQSDSSPSSSLSSGGPDTRKPGQHQPLSRASIIRSTTYATSALTYATSNASSRGLARSRHPEEALAARDRSYEPREENACSSSSGGSSSSGEGGAGAGRGWIGGAAGEGERVRSGEGEVVARRMERIATVRSDAGGHSTPSRRFKASQRVASAPRCLPVSGSAQRRGGRRGWRRGAGGASQRARLRSRGPGRRLVTTASGPPQPCRAPS